MSPILVPFPSPGWRTSRLRRPNGCANCLKPISDFGAVGEIRRMEHIAVTCMSDSRSIAGAFVEQTQLGIDRRVISIGGYRYICCANEILRVPQQAVHSGKRPVNPNRLRIELRRILQMWNGSAKIARVDQLLRDLQR